MEERERVEELIRNEVKDWDDEVVCRARFKALSGQRSDWEPIYLFWRNLILTIARQLGLLIIRPSHLNTQWFNRGGLTPLCLDRVLVTRSLSFIFFLLICVCVISQILTDY